MLKKKQRTSAELGMRTSSDLQQPHCFLSREDRFANERKSDFLKMRCGKFRKRNGASAKKIEEVPKTQNSTKYSIRKHSVQYSLCNSRFLAGGSEHEKIEEDS